MNTQNHDSPSEDDPLAQSPLLPVLVPHVFRFVEAGPGKGKTHTALSVTMLKVVLGEKWIVAFPTRKLAREIERDMLPRIAKELGIDIKPVVILSKDKSEWEKSKKERRRKKGKKDDKTDKDDPRMIGEQLCEFIGEAEGGQLLICAHEGLRRIIDPPEKIKDWYLLIDEVFDPTLSKRVRLRYSHHDLGRPTELERGFGFVRALPLTTTLGAKGTEKEYYHIAPILDPNNEDPWFPIRLRLFGQRGDQVYEGFGDIPLWLLRKDPLFTHGGNWDKMVRRPSENKATQPQGQITITGICRPEKFMLFRSVTIMSALFQHTMLHNLWSKLGIQFKPSTDIKVSGKTTALGKRRLRIGYLTEAPWSKNARDESGGIPIIFEVIAKSGFLDRNQTTGIVINNDDREDPTGLVAEAINNWFPRHEMLPHNVRGSNEWTHLRQLIHVSALNPDTVDILWIERALGIDSTTQRLARLAQEVYQTAMRLNIRLANGEGDIKLVVSEKLIADWLVPLFTPRSQVTVVALDPEKRLHQSKANGRPRTYEGQTKKERHAEAQRQLRARQKAKKQWRVIE
jgi:hypothetical protein